MSEPREYNLTTAWIEQRIVELSETLARGGILHEAYVAVVEARKLADRAESALAEARKELDAELPVLEAAREVAKVEFCDWTDDELKEAVAWAGQRTIKSAKLAALVLSVRELNAARAAEEEEDRR